MSEEVSHSGSNQLWELLPKAVNAIVALSALGYFVGWQEAQAYYKAIGADWAATLMPSLTLLQHSANTIATIAFSTFFSLVLLGAGKISMRKLSWVAVSLALISSVCLSASQGVFGLLPSQLAYWCALAGAAFYAVSAGSTLAEIYGSSRVSQGTASSGLFRLVYWAVLPGIFWSPHSLGTAQALRDMDVTLSPLPIVSLDSTQGAGAWRLVQILQDKALLVKLDGKELNRQFRVVEAKDIRSIAVTSKSDVRD